MEAVTVLGDRGGAIMTVLGDRGDIEIVEYQAPELSRSIDIVEYQASIARGARFRHRSLVFGNLDLLTPPWSLVFGNLDSLRRQLRCPPGLSGTVHHHPRGDRTRAAHSSTRIVRLPDLLTVKPTDTTPNNTPPSHQTRTPTLDPPPQIADFHL
ncbi:MAG: hypothetical protein LBK59_03710 [Bifidobacteriaceae bacterium]|nr:hypothetical protein [Bifidobacteriaceae bacterium]